MDCVEWIIDSITKRQKQNEYDYRVVEKQAGNAVISDYFRSSKGTASDNSKGSKRQKTT
jgi:hypothetical protein